MSCWFKNNVHGPLMERHKNEKLLCCLNMVHFLNGTINRMLPYIL